jgi:glycolate oxidase
MNRIIEVDPVLRTATVEAGVITHDLDLAANKHGLFYPPDPASHKESTLGGNLAECAGGLRCVKYGVTKDYVVGLEYVDSGGTLRLAGSMSDAPGIFDIVSLLIGSEGTLGIVTKMRVELLPIPESRMTLLYAFTRESDAAEAVTAIRGAGVLPCVLEFMDAGAIAAAAQHLNLKELHKAAALLLVELDGVAAQVERDAVQVISIVRKLNPVLDRQTRDESEREDMWHIRRELSTAIKSLSKVKTSEELNTASFGHAGDGNLHVCFIIPELSPQIIQRMESAKTQLLRTTLNMGGTISGEHGIGFTKKAFLVDEVGSDVIELSSLIKKSFDPHGLFNPGKIF